MVWVTWSSEEKKKLKWKKDRFDLYEMTHSIFEEELNIPFYYTSLPTAPRSTDKLFINKKGKKTTFLIYVCP